MKYGGEDDAYEEGHIAGFDLCKKLVLQLLDKYATSNISIEEIKNKIKNKDFEYGKF